MLAVEKYRATETSRTPSPRRKLGQKPTSPHKKEDLEYRYPDFGPLNINSYIRYLEFSQDYFAIHYGKSSHPKVKLEDFTISHELGHGSFGNVVLATHNATNKQYGIKIISKEKLVKLKSVEQTLQEKNILQGLNSPFTIYLAHFMMDNSYLYFVLPYIKGGELFYVLNEMGRFKEPQAQFYIAQIILGLEYLHNLDLIYRDLKPENVMIDHTGYLKLVDFGFSKVVPKTSRTYTFCGTPEYIAPEIILNRGHGPAADWWAAGVVLYEMVSGFTPFHHKNKMRIYEKIVTKSYEMCESFSENLKDLINNFLQADATKRIGNLRGGVDDIKRHKWFRSVNWLAILNRKLTPEFIPKQEPPLGSVSNRYMSSLYITPEDKFKDLFSEYENVY